jgi:hypothetical protein
MPRGRLLSVTSAPKAEMTESAVPTAKRSALSVDLTETLHRGFRFPTSNQASRAYT